MPNPTCSTCRYWQPDTMGGIQSQTFGTCHAMPPTRGFPAVFGNEWCGQHSSHDQGPVMTPTYIKLEAKAAKSKKPA
jgi:hypothetical protein